MYIRRAVLPASPEGDVAQSSDLALLPLLSLSVVVLILLFFVVRFAKRGLHLPNLAWLRGKGKGSKGRLGLTGVELLPTSFKSIPASSPSPFSATFNLAGNAGKSGNSTILSRSSSLDALHQLSTSSPPHLTSRKHADWQVPFSLPAFFKTKNKPLHRRSRSLSTSHRTTSSSMLTSTPSSPKTLLIDISTSSSSPMSASSDLGTHKLHPASAPLIPDLPIPTPSPVKINPIPRDSKVWTFDVEDESHDITDFHVKNTFLAAFKRSQPEVHAKPSADIVLHIQGEMSSSPPPPTPSLVPKRLSTSHPFSSLVDSFTSQTFISDRPAASSSSLPVTPSFPPGIELVPIESTAVQSTTNLLDLSKDDTRAGCGSSSIATGSTQKAPFLDPLIASDEDMTPTHDIHMETVIYLADSVSDPFDDSHAITLPGDVSDGWTSDPALSLAEESHLPPTELALPIQSPAPSLTPAVSAPLSPHLFPSQVKPVEVGKAPSAESEELTSSWRWNDSWSPSGFSVLHSAPESIASLGKATDKDANLAEQEEDLMSFDHEEAVSVDEERGQHRVDCVVDPGTDANNKAEPTDAWFTEESTAVWDASWTGENVKEGVLLDMSHEKGTEDDEIRMPQEVHINVLDEHLVGPREPIRIHIFGEISENSISEHPLSKDSETLAVTTPSNDNHDVKKSIMPHSAIATPIIAAATPLSSTPATPDTPLPELPSSALLASSPIAEECPDPDIMPLPELPPLFVAPTPVSPVPIKAQPPSVCQAQTPTPPDSPPPSIATARPLWSLRATDAHSLGLPAAAGILPVSEVCASEEAKPIIEVEKMDDADRVIPVDVVVKEVTMVERIIEAANESTRELGKQSSLTTLEPGLSTSVPGSFPKSPSKPSAALPAGVLPPSSATPIDSPSTKTPHTRAVVPSADRIHTSRSLLDIALAMQLRPGLGVGADPAWMVRFLMAVFGWFAVLVSGDLQS
ncbi:hypothetical protein E4T56_gene19267 [Termitomyces sp. T112]|nr:hypothetical protein E4T56_gene19267 [Termitomyces sp. T112]KAH0581037.1 hypothetical protein H2248_012178 [Termitomyces sp. 'cryptogamus']KNZ79107.1 hypothetical protein J132_01155 [Termitomyces sp. J132]